MTWNVLAIVYVLLLYPDKEKNMQTRIALVGIGGYGTYYLQEILRSGPESDIQLVAGIDPYPEHARFFGELQAAQIPIYPDLATFYQNDTADLVILAAPIQLHAPLTCLALSKGSHVLCEKPLGASIQDARQMLEAEQKTGKIISIGYQWSFSDAILALKGDILSGRLGRPLSLKSIVLWSRPRSYYQRNNWAGRVKSQAGDWVLDSPVNNATAHYLHNMLFVLGNSLNRSARPTTLQVELYRANPIENYDSAALRMETETGAQLLFLTAHPVNDNLGPRGRYEFENAVVEFSEEDMEFRATFKDGSVKNYGSPEATPYNKLWQTIDAIRTGSPVVCGVRTAIPQLQCVLGAHEAPIHPFPRDLIKTDDNGSDQTTWVEGLSEVFQSCYQSDQLPSETRQAAWANGAAKIDMAKYAIT